MAKFIGHSNRAVRRAKINPDHSEPSDKSEIPGCGLWVHSASGSAIPSRFIFSPEEHRLEIEAGIKMNGCIQPE